MVYTSTSLALASLEFFVHLDPSQSPEDLVFTSATVPDDAAIEQIAIHDLPQGWRTAENASTQQLGANWIAGRRSLALKVPSIAVEGDWNVLLNPAHPDFARIVIDEPQSWSFDERMFLPRIPKEQ